jgi:ABC-type dipeptide/oligopeptide/nickel transport system permease component
MARYIFVSAGQLLFVLLVVSLITFLLMHAVPGGPFDIKERALPEATRLLNLKSTVSTSRFGNSTSATFGPCSTSTSASRSRARPKR